MPSSDDADKKKNKPEPVPFTRQDTSELEMPDSAGLTRSGPPPEREQTAVLRPEENGDAPPARDGVPTDEAQGLDVTAIEEADIEHLPQVGDTGNDQRRGAPAAGGKGGHPPIDATAELSQEQIDALPSLQHYDAGGATPLDPASKPSVTSDAWGSFEENNAWLAVSQTGRRLHPGAQKAVEQAPPEALLEPSSSSPSAESVVPARIVAVQAQDTKRREFVLSRQTVRVGRGSANQIIIDNPSVSREHARFTWHRGEWTVHDLKSGNGVFVNQQRVAGARALRHGDEVMFGQTLWQFAVDTVGVPPMPASSTAEAMLPPAPRAPGRPWVTYALGAGVVVLVGALVVTQVRSSGDKPADADAVAFAALHDGIAAFKAHQWEQAERRFEKLAAVSAQDPTAKTYLKAIERERAAEQQLQQAHEAHQKGDLVAAWQLTQGVLDSTFRREAQAFAATLQAALDARVQAAQRALDGGKFSMAKELLQTVEEAQPGRPDAAIIQVRLALRQTGAKGAVHLANLGRTRQMPPLSGPTAVAVRYFIDGDVAHALELFDSQGSEEAATLRQAVQRFKDALDGALNEYRNKRFSAAIKLFNQARAEELRISHGQCKLVNEIDHKQADMHYFQGLQQFAANTLPAAYQSLKAAITLVPGHALASHKLAELDQKAQDILEGSGGSRATRAQLQLVLQIVPVTSDLYRKAKSRLDALP